MNRKQIDNEFARCVEAHGKSPRLAVNNNG